MLEVALDYLAVGIDPTKTTICMQSAIPELAELSLLFMNLVTVARLERNPTVRDEIRRRGFERDVPVGFLAYPISQAADITAFQASLVPVGADQLPMLEQTNEIVRRFNRLYGQTLVETEPLLSSTPRLPGVDGDRKMSKSAKNGIALGADPAEICTKVDSMFTDPGHLRVSDPGRIEGNVVFAYLAAFDADQDDLEELKAHYRRGGLGDGVVKRRLREVLLEFLAPIRARRVEYAQDRAQVWDMLRTVTDKARERAAATMANVRKAMGIDYFGIAGSGRHGRLV